MDRINLRLLDGTVSKDLHGELGHLNLLNYFFVMFLWIFKKKEGQSKNVLFILFSIFFSNTL